MILSIYHRHPCGNLTWMASATISAPELPNALTEARNYFAGYPAPNAPDDATPVGYHARLEQHRAGQLAGNWWVCGPKQGAL
jgi:hypothetical protein